jgi:hypothetical protein
MKSPFHLTVTRSKTNASAFVPIHTSTPASKGAARPAATRAAPATAPVPASVPSRSVSSFKS